MVLEPPFQVQILVHPSTAGIQYQAGKLQGLPILQILIDQNLPLRRKVRRNPGISISWQIDEIERSIDTIKIDRLCPARRVAGKSQALLTNQRINQAGFPNVTSP